MKKFVLVFSVCVLLFASCATNKQVDKVARVVSDNILATEIDVNLKEAILTAMADYEGECKFFTNYIKYPNETKAIVVRQALKGNFALSCACNTKNDSKWVDFGKNNVLYIGEKNQVFEKDQEVLVPENGQLIQLGVYDFKSAIPNEDGSDKYASVPILIMAKAK